MKLQHINTSMYICICKLKVFAVGHKNRATAATTMNIESSRSHALLCIKVTGKNLTSGARTLGEATIVSIMYTFVICLLTLFREVEFN